MLTLKSSIAFQLLLLSSLGALVHGQPTQAQSIVAEPNGTQTIITENGSQYAIEGGSLSGDGSNLFHSFEQFGLESGEIANFLSDPNIQNILGRVVGNDPSIINGLIQVSNSGANLYLLNPAGVIFGADATLNVPADFTMSTANGVGIGNDWFNVDGEHDYASLVGNPHSLLFATEQPGSIINAGNLAVSDGNLNLIGGTVVNTGTLSGSHVTVAAVPGQRRVRLDHPQMLLSLELLTPDDNSPESVDDSSLSGLLTGGDVAVVTGVNVDDTGRLWLLDTSVATGDVVVTGQISGDQVQLAAANQVNVDNPTHTIRTHAGRHSAPIVTRFGDDGTNANELIFLDAIAPDSTQLLYGTKSGTTTVVVPVSENGIERITEFLSQVGATDVIDAVHIVSEGNEGEFWLGNAYVSEETLEQYRTQLQQWGGLLGSEADILIYACLTARGDAGLALLDQIAGLTGADIAGSTDLTGSSSRGGDWILEHSVGTIEADNAFEQTALTGYDGLLQVFTATDATSLIDAINQANGNVETDTINLANDVTLTAVDNATDGDNGLPSILADGGNKLTINGMGNTISRDAAAPNFRLLHVALGADLEINETTLSGGVADPDIPFGTFFPGADGGAISNKGTLTINNSTISGNRALDDGGAIVSYGNITDGAVVTINNSTISGNEAAGNGGGLSNTSFTSPAPPAPNSAVMTINNSTISGNTANVGGGVSNLGQNSDNSAVITVNNSTVSGNTAVFGGGGFYNRGQTSTMGATITITNSTITQNEVTNPGSSAGGILNLNVGVAANTALVTLNNSIVAQNTATVHPDIRQANATNSPIVDGGNNLIGVDAQGIFTTSTLVGSVAAPLDPVLLPLGDYGGPTQTHAFYLGSPVIDAGSDALATAAGLTTDQRGADRFNGPVDIGAFESQGYSLTVVDGDGQNTLVNEAFGTVLAVQVTENFVNTPLPIPDVDVTFTANPGSGGASAGPDSSVTTDATGLATATSVLTANETGGDFTVTAAAAMLDAATFNLTNTAPDPEPTPEPEPEPTVTLPSNLLELWIDLQSAQLLSDSICETVPDVDIVVDIPDLDLPAISNDEKQTTSESESDCQLHY